MHTKREVRENRRGRREREQIPLRAFGCQASLREARQTGMSVLLTEEGGETKMFVLPHGSAYGLVLPERIPEAAGVIRCQGG